MYKIYKEISYPVVLIFLLLLYGCYTSNVAVKNKNLHYIYNPGQTQIHPQAYIYHPNDSQTTVFIKVPGNQLLFESKIPNASPEAGFQVRYQLLESFKSNQVLDSGLYEYSFNEDYKNKEIIVDITINAKDTANYVLNLLVTDINRKKGNQMLLFINKTDKNHTQNYLVTDKLDNNPVFNYFVYPGQAVNIKCNDDVSELFVDHIDDNFPLPNPPFSADITKKYKITTDTAFIYKCSANSEIVIDKEGLYRIRKDTSYKSGLVLYNFGKYYPDVKTPGEMLKSLRYLTTSREFEQYQMFKDKKEAVDNFWVNTGNINRARELIRIYYNREKYANLFFTSFTQGWKTDRGMIYLVFGPPSIIYKDDFGETWIYGSNINMQTMKFRFNKINNPLTDNDFELQRSSIYKIIWYEAVDSWRNGRAFSIMK
ncbi:MAG: hypothetical protein Kow0068_07720 [Marinilabiliales bacterium]